MRVRSFSDDVDEILSHTNPHPGRVGCPCEETPIPLARKDLRLDHPAYEHLTRCSPFYVEFRSLAESTLADGSRCCSSDLG